jgi:hypothetical protein
MDIKAYISQLDDNTHALIQLANSYPAGILTIKKDDRWSILEILEHITITDRVVISLLQRPSEEVHIEEEIYGKQKLERILVRLREKKIISPEGLRPKGVLKSVPEFENLFVPNRNTLKSMLQNGSIVIDNRIYLHPFLGNMTVSDWLYFVIHHTERHTKQIEDISKAAVSDQRLAIRK